MNEEYFHIEKNYFKYEITVAKKLLKNKGPHILDIGGGIGKTHVVLNKNGFDTISIEPSFLALKEIAISKFKLDESKFLHSSIEDASFEENYFDFITFGAVLEHLYEPSESRKSNKMVKTRWSRSN